MEFSSSGVKEEIRKLIQNPPKQWMILLATLLLLIISVYLSRINSSLSLLPTIFGVLIILELAYFLGKEVKEGTNKNGWKGELVETFYALVIALVIWYGASFLLNTSSPISAVASCSMLPNLDRGDFVIVQGSMPQAYEISMTQSELNSLTNPAEVRYPGGNVTITSSIYVYCEGLNNKGQQVCQDFAQNPQTFIEQKGALKYIYAKCPKKISSTDGYSACVESIEFRGTKYLTNFSHDVVVYQPKPTDLFYQIGDIVHRVYFKINSENKSYYLTRGDNNPILDIQAANSPIQTQNLKGKVIARIPFLGYFKLLISGMIKEDNQCSTQLTFDHV